MKSTFTSCNSVWMDLSNPDMLQVQQIRHQSAYTTVHNILNILRYFILVMFSSTFNQQTPCSQIVINEYTSPSGACSSSGSDSASISIDCCSPCKGGCWNPKNCQLHVNRPLEGGSPAQLNRKFTGLAALQPHLTWDWLSSMLGPMLPYPKIASASVGSVKWPGAWEGETQKTYSAQRLYKMAANCHSTICCTYSKRTRFSILWMQT